MFADGPAYSEMAGRVSWESRPTICLLQTNLEQFPRATRRARAVTTKSDQSCLWQLHWNGSWRVTKSGDALMQSLADGTGRSSSPAPERIGKCTDVLVAEQSSNFRNRPNPCPCGDAEQDCTAGLAARSKISGPPRRGSREGSWADAQFPRDGWHSMTSTRRTLEDTQSAAPRGWVDDIKVQLPPGDEVH